MGKKRRLARQEKKSKKSKASASSTVSNIAIDSETFGERIEASEGDSNALILVPKPKSSIEPNEDDGKKKKKKLTARERKRLQKIVEAKEKKAKRARLLESLAQHAVSSKEAALLRPTVIITKGRETRREAEIRFEIEGRREEEEEEEGSDELIIVKGRRRRRKLPGVLRGWTSQKRHEIDEEEIEESEDSSSNNTDTNDDQQEEEEEEKATVTITESNDSKPEENVVTLNAEVSRRPAVFRAVQRHPDIQLARLRLPILGNEQEIMEAIFENDVLIICGETGSGKTTQVPQFLYESGFGTRTNTKDKAKDNGSLGGMIGITEPRRVAAISMSKRVACEMNLSQRFVSYQIRYEGNVSDDTLIKFMTDGTLLREVQQDFLLTKYSVIIIDEAHERSVFTDILIGLLSRIVVSRRKRKNPLKLIIMSATLRIEDFTDNRRLFPAPPPLLRIQSRQYPVTVHFNRKTPDNYLDEAFRKVCKIHRTLPSGGILVFVTGRQEVHQLCRWLKKTFPSRSKVPEDEEEEEEEEEKTKTIDLDKYPTEPAYLKRLEIDNETDSESSDEEESDVDDELSIDAELPLHVLPLYSLLPSEKQTRIFDSPPRGCRLCVVSTNIAETSLTIPNVKYVVDTGLAKHKLHDPITGISSFRIRWTSKASANQRAGRAGRTEPGHCYRLFSSAVFQNELEDFSRPEIVSRPVDDLVLQMKTMGIVKVSNFPFPTPPEQEAIKTAEKLLINLGAIAKETRRSTETDSDAFSVTALGHTMSKFPLSPKYAKMLVVGHQFNCLPYVVTLVAALGARELLCESTPGTGGELKWLQRRKFWAGQGESGLLGDFMVLLRAVGACEYSGNAEKFCTENGLRYKAMIEARKLRAQLTNSVNKVVKTVDLGIDPKMPPPSQQQARILRQIVLAGLAGHVAKKTTAADGENVYETLVTAEPAFIHPTSVLSQKKPDYVVFEELFEAGKIYMRGLCAIEPEWLPILASNQCTFSKPLEQPPPTYDVESGSIKCHRSSTFGTCCWTLPAVELDYPFGLDKYKWFARFLLEGKVVTKLAHYTSSLLSSPSVMIKSWSKLHKRTELILASLIEKGVDNRSRLVDEFEKNNRYLLREYLEWLPADKHNEITLAWPPSL